MAAPTRWTSADIPDQSGRHVVITGGNSGIGVEAARMLAGAGARVTLAVRNLAKGEQAAAGIGGAVDARELDLTRLDSVRDFAAATDEPVDVLVNNAGVMAVPFSRTADGFETQFGTNHLGPFALTNLLLPRITDRVVTISSGAHRAGRIDLDDLNWQRRPYRRWEAYGQSKLANLLFTLELQRRLTAAGSPVRALAAHPGYSATNLQFHYGNAVVDRAMAVLNRVFGQSAAMGALPTAYAVTQDLPGGSYVGPDGRNEVRGYPTLVGRSAAASDVQLAERLWSASEELTGARFPAEIAAP
ncbi:MAG TPA: oxidoreductase [Propionibacteriaceae bacterium]|nr:oxidoreductase [Propionibacteriaceae bacterium]